MFAIRKAHRGSATEAGVPRKRTKLVDAFNTGDNRDILAVTDISFPDSDFSGVDEPLLDTRRTLLEQIDAYNSFNVRS